MQLIKDKYSILVKCANAEDSRALESAFSEVLNKPVYEDELGLYDVEGNINGFWTVNEYFTVAAEETETIDIAEDTIKSLAQRLGLN